MSSFERKGLVDNHLTEISLLATRRCPEARIEATTEVFEDEDGRVRVHPPAGLREEEIADIEGKLANRRDDILVKTGVSICSASPPSPATSSRLSGMPGSKLIPNEDMTNAVQEFYPQLAHF